MEGRRERQASIHPTEAHSFVASKYCKWRKGSRPRKGSRSGQLEATPEELGQMFGIEGDLSSGQVPPIPPEKMPGRGPLGGGSTPYRMFDISNRETRANLSQA